MEDLLAPVLEGDSGGGAAGFAVVVEDGAATFTDPAGGVTAVSGLNATVRVPAGAAIPETAELTADFGDGERSGAVAASLAAGGEFTLRADGVPLAAAGPLAVRFGTDDPAAAWSLGGAADADLAGTLAAAGGTVSGAVRGARVVARNAAWPVGDRVTLETAELDGGVAWRDGGLVADRLRFASAPLTVTADGPLPLSVPADPADVTERRPPRSGEPPTCPPSPPCCPAGWGCGTACGSRPGPSPSPPRSIRGGRVPETRSR